jgi:hypothetical protein
MEWRQERHTPGAESLALLQLVAGLKRVMKKWAPRKKDTYGTAPAVPLSKTRIFQHPLKPCAPTEEQRLKLFQQPVKPWAYPEAKAKPDI